MNLMNIVKKLAIVITYFLLILAFWVGIKNLLTALYQVSISMNQELNSYQWGEVIGAVLGNFIFLSLSFIISRWLKKKW